MNHFELNDDGSSKLITAHNKTELCDCGCRMRCEGEWLILRACALHASAPDLLQVCRNLLFNVDQGLIECRWTEKDGSGTAGKIVNFDNMRTIVMKATL